MTGPKTAKQRKRGWKWSEASITAARAKWEATRRKERGKRDDTMASMYRAGYTLEQIGQQYGITRERVRQVISKHHGLSANDGGLHVQAERRRVQRLAKRDARYLAKHGCTFEQYLVLRSGGSHAPTRAFGMQRSNAARRDIGWELTIWQWWSIWQASGHWAERGRGQGYVMCRHGDEGPYAVGNVFIALAAENNSKTKFKKSGLPIGVHKITKGKYRTFTSMRQLNGKRYYLGSFKTPEQAHAAYLAAPETIQSKAA